MPFLSVPDFNKNILLSNFLVSQTYYEERLNLFLRKISLAVYIRRNHHYFNLKLKYTVLYIYLLKDVAGFLKITISMHENIITAGRLKLCGMENRTVVAHGCRKTKS